jgi:hypothetical protein
MNVPAGKLHTASTNYGMNVPAGKLHTASTNYGMNVPAGKLHTASTNYGMNVPAGKPGSTPPASHIRVRLKIGPPKKVAFFIRYSQIIVIND